MTREEFLNIGLVQDFEQSLLFERNLSEHTAVGYLQDLKHLYDYAESQNTQVVDLTYPDLETFLGYLHDAGIGVRSVARIVSGIKAYFKFLESEEVLQENPTDLLESPKIGRNLPEVLTVEEIDAIMDNIDTNTPNGLRNAAMVEFLYSCGLRVSELCNLCFNELYLEKEYIRVLGKGSKERLVPMSPSAIERVREYLPLRHSIAAKEPYQHHLFLSRNKMAISRQMVFRIIKELARAAGITKSISPHTFRHSFATHLLEGGAPLQAIRDMLGHTDISTTEIYTHIDRTQLRNEILKHHPRNQQ